MSQTKKGAALSAAKKLGITLQKYLSNIEKGLKRCYACKKWIPKKFFCIDRTRHDSLNPRCYLCREIKSKFYKPGTSKSEKIKIIWKLRKNNPSWIHPMKGKHFSEKARVRMGCPKGIPSKFKGIPRSLEIRKKISVTVRLNTPRGSQCHSYKDGKMAERRSARFSLKYKRWRFDVFLRDKFTCRRCGDKKGGNLHAHHFKPYADFPKLRFTISNGITLCKKCHKKIHKNLDPLFIWSK